MSERMLTTIDNPFNPFTHWREWFAYDTTAGYNTTAYLARIVRTSDDISDVDQALALDEGIDEILDLNVLGLYRAITENEKPGLV